MEEKMAKNNQKNRARRNQRNPPTKEGKKKGETLHLDKRRWANTKTTRLHTHK